MNKQLKKEVRNRTRNFLVLLFVFLLFVVSAAWSANETSQNITNTSQGNASLADNVTFVQSNTSQIFLNETNGKNNTLYTMINNSNGTNDINSSLNATDLSYIGNNDSDFSEYQNNSAIRNVSS